jgi:hypothetical protein
MFLNISYGHSAQRTSKKRSPSLVSIEEGSSGDGEFHLALIDPLPPSGSVQRTLEKRSGSVASSEDSRTDS